VSFWLILTRADVALCLTDPGYEIQLRSDADLATLYRVWGERISYREALASGRVRVDGPRTLVRTFPLWFDWGRACAREARGVAGTCVSQVRR
jgi:hypothetical protein